MQQIKPGTLGRTASLFDWIALDCTGFFYARYTKHWDVASVNWPEVSTLQHFSLIINRRPAFEKADRVEKSGL